jgi:hypothetical protein
MREERIGPSAQDIERAISQLSDVVEARVIVGDDGDPTEIHVLSGVARPPKQIVRDVESALLTQLGLRINHRIVSVAQVGSKDGRARAIPSVGRIELGNVELWMSGLICRIQVRLNFRGKESVATTSGPSNGGNILRLTAHATAAALKGYLAEECCFVVDEVMSVTLGGSDVVIVPISIILPREKVELVGASIVRRDAHEASAAATLDAVNRVLGILKTKSQD